MVSPIKESISNKLNRFPFFWGLADPESVIASGSVAVNWNEDYIGNELALFKIPGLGDFAAVNRTAEKVEGRSVLEIVSADGTTAGEITWTEKKNCANSVDRMVEDLLFERYRCEDAGTGLLRKLYYLLKPLIPRNLQINMRRNYAKKQAEIPFPHWPIEESVVVLYKAALAVWQDRTGEEVVKTTPFWPEGKRFACCLTHDVEGAAGCRNASALMELEMELGFRSCWNLVPERYSIPDQFVERLQIEGFEIGVHGLHHDGKLFSNERVFSKRLGAIFNYAERWGAKGFRSPATHRKADWMTRISLQYDSSFPDADVYEPIPGGCCQPFPFFIGDLVELPITMAQDHTLWEILQLEDISVWQQKLEWLRNTGGLCVMIVHPDYVTSDRRLRLYAEFLHIISALSDCWTALPHEIASWWRTRSEGLLKHQSRAFE